MSDTVEKEGSKQDIEDHAVQGRIWTWILRIVNTPFEEGRSLKGWLPLLECWGEALQCSSHLLHSSSSQLFLGVVTSFCCFKSRWSWIVSAQVPPGPSSSSAWKLSEKDKGTRSLYVPTIHRLCSWPPASLVSKHSPEETRKGILLNVAIIVVPTLKCNHILPTAVWAGIYWALLTSQTLKHCVSTFKGFSHY